MKQKHKPLLAITMGDAAGSGPEIIAKALANPESRQVCRGIVVGDAAVMRVALEITGVHLEVRAIERIADATYDEAVIEVIDLHNIQLDRLKRGQVDAMAGKAAYEYIKFATALALNRECDAIVTSAINKEALNKAGYHYDGHTQLLAELCEASDVAMMLVSEQMRVAHVSTHVALKRAIELVRSERILTVLRLTDEFVRRFSIKKPRIAVAGLNPHAGESGLFGDEEMKYIAPAIEAARDEGLNVVGPLPPDSVFFRTSQGEFDASIAMYHDQGHIALKMLGFTRGVNVTLGLPIIRTSVDHGTAFDMAGKGTADPSSLVQAIKLASLLCNKRQ